MIWNKATLKLMIDMKAYTWKAAGSALREWTKINKMPNTSLRLTSKNLKKNIFTMDLKLCIKISEIFVTKTVCELDPRVKKLLYVCSCPYVFMLDACLSTFLCSCQFASITETFSMLMSLCFYARAHIFLYSNIFYACIPIFICFCPYVFMLKFFLCSFSYVSMLEHILWQSVSVLLPVCFYTRVCMFRCLLWPAVYDLYGCLLWLYIASTYMFMCQFDSNSNI